MEPTAIPTKDRTTALNLAKTSKKTAKYWDDTLASWVYVYPPAEVLEFDPFWLTAMPSSKAWGNPPDDLKVVSKEPGRKLSMRPRRD